MATSIYPSLSCLIPFYTIPIFPLLSRKIFHLLVLSRILAQSCVTPFPEYICTMEGLRIIVLVSLNSIAKGTSCFHYFSHDVSLYRHSFSFILVYNLF